jgi:small subunit ribosomal protein S1
VLRIGQEIDVYVLGINSQEKKIALSIKRTQAEPWSRVAAAYEVGQLVRGTVTQLANFGAFARIEDGIEGLIHVSELTDERITHPKQVVREGQDLILRIIRIDPQRRRMGLSLRRALDTPDAELTAVLGEGAVEERDAIVQAIRAALEAEGIEIGSGRSASEDDAERESGELAASASGEGAGTSGSSANAEAQRDEPGAPAPDGIVATADGIETAPATAGPTPAASAGGGRSRNQRQNIDVPTDIAGEPLSAIELAFAMAGASFDLEDDDEQAANEGKGSEG